jgi:hypothetical protein
MESFVKLIWREYNIFLILKILIVVKKTIFKKDQDRFAARIKNQDSFVSALRILGSWFLVLGSWFLVLGSWF